MNSHTHFRTYSLTYLLTCLLMSGCTGDLPDAPSGISPGDFPAAPTSLVADSVSYDAVYLRWNDNSNNETGFGLGRRISGGWQNRGRSYIDCTYWEDTGLEALTQYHYRVFAYNFVGDSEYSNEVSITTDSKPSAPEIEWYRTFGGGSHDYGHSIQQTTDGGYIIVGSTYSFGAGRSDVYLIKTDGQGNEQWYRNFGSTYVDYGNSIVQTTDGGFIIAGQKDETDSEVYLIKTDGQGIERWYRTFSDGYWNHGSSVQQTRDGGYIIAGDSWHDYSYLYLVKSNSEGDLLWYNTFGGTDNYESFSIQQTTDGGYIIAGSKESYNLDEIDVYLIKTDGQGNEQWLRTFGGSDYDHGRSVRQTTDGGYIIVGSTSSFGSGRSDVYLIKIDGLGNEQWYRTFGGNDGDYGNSIEQTTDGGFIIAGQTESFGSGESDVYLIKTDGQGNELWHKIIGGNNYDYGKSVKQTTDGGYIIAGVTRSFGAGGRDVYLIKISGR